MLNVNNNGTSTTSSFLCVKKKRSLVTQRITTKTSALRSNKWRSELNLINSCFFSSVRIQNVCTICVLCVCIVYHHQTKSVYCLSLFCNFLFSAFFLVSKVNFHFIWSWILYEENLIHSSTLKHHYTKYVVTFMIILNHHMHCYAFHYNNKEFLLHCIYSFLSFDSSSLLRFRLE